MQRVRRCHHKRGVVQYENLLAEVLQTAGRQAKEV